MKMGRADSQIVVMMVWRSARVCGAGCEPACCSEGNMIGAFVCRSRR